MGRMPARLAIAAGALTLVAPAIAYVCHPDPAGTRSLALHGHIAGYSLQGSTVTVAFQTGSSCQVLIWQASKARPEPSSARCRSVTATRSRIAAPAAARVIVAGSSDRPDRLRVLGPGGGVVHAWPLPVRVRPGTLQVSGSLAAFMARGGNGVWVTGLETGRTTLVAPVRAGDHPLLASSGVAYQDNVLKNAPANRTLLKFVPMRALRGELARVGRPLHTGGRIRAFSADGNQVALVVAGNDGCDRVVFWSVLWRSAFQVSQKRGATCAPGSAASGRISDLALAGNRAEWVTLHRGRPMLVAADGVGCQEWVIRRLSDLGRRTSLVAIAGDGRTLAFSLVDRSAALPVSTIGRVTGGYRGRDLARLRGTVLAVSADGGRIGALAADGSIVLNSSSGFDRRLDIAGATSLALRRNLVVATTRQGRLEVFSMATARRLHSWALPRGAAHVDLHYGIAVVTAGHSVFAIDVATGRTARLAVAPAVVRAQIEPIGVVYAYSTGHRGTARLVPMSRVEHAVR